MPYYSYASFRFVPFVYFHCHSLEMDLSQSYFLLHPLSSFDFEIDQESHVVACKGLKTVAAAEVEETTVGGIAVVPMLSIVQDYLRVYLQLLHLVIQELRLLELVHSFHTFVNGLAERLVT